MSELALAAVLAVTIPLASTISIEVGLSVALIELAAGVAVGNCAPDAVFMTLLMSTGPTFGTITSLYGLQSGIIDRTQFSLLLTVIVLSAVVPTAIAQRMFQPSPVEAGARRAVR